MKPMPFVGAATLPRLSPYSRPGVTGMPSASTAVRDGTIAETATARASGRPSCSRACQRTVPPGLLGVMLESVRCGYLQPVRNARPRRYLAVLVGGHRFDRGRADVDADCHLFA